MKLRLSVTRSNDVPQDDVVVTTDTTVTVGALADAIERCRPGGSDPAPWSSATLRVIDSDGPRVIPPDRSLADARLRSGQVVSVVIDDGHYTDGRDPAPAAAHLEVVSGPEAPQRFELRSGANHVGRDRGNEVRLSDPMISKRHLRINVAAQVEVIDLGSSNGVVVGGEQVARAVVGPDDDIVLGDTVVRVVAGPGAHGTGPSVLFNRSPYLDPVYGGVEVEAPEPPTPPQPTRIPFIPMLAPMLLGGVLYLLTRQLVSVLFVAMSPLLMIGSALESRFSGRRSYRAALERFAVDVEDLRATMAGHARAEVAARQHEHPDVGSLVDGALTFVPLLWYRRPDQRGFLDVRLGLGALASRSMVKASPARGAEREVAARVTDVVAEFALVAPVPVVASLSDVGAIGVAGTRELAVGVARSVMTHLVCAHSPAELVVAGLASSASAPAWDWLKWLPHVGGDHSPLAVEHLAATTAAGNRLVAAVEALIDARRGEASTPGDRGPTLPVVVVLVEDDAPVERHRLVQLVEEGPAVGVHVVWVAAAVASLPAGCRAYVDLASDGAAVGFVLDGHAIAPVAVDSLGAEQTRTISRHLAPVIDAGARLDDESDLPPTVSLVSLVGRDRVSDSDAVLERWRVSDGSGEVSGRRRREATLRAVVGQSADQDFVIDLRRDGPHALVGGTTGSGKSEFLQSWVSALALEHSPERLTFLFVDYKGGAAFSECVRLPHTVGLVTDLSPHLVQRALRSLNAELRYRERVLRARGAKDLVELERRADGDAPPSLVIVVDEFAALVSEVPEFVDGVVNVAQRGRSLGLHLVLATQRPAGVIKDNLRANTNLRIALRMADADDSTDVVGHPLASGFDPAVPGRAVAKAGPARLVTFQSGYVGGWTTDEPPPPVITIDELVFGRGQRWEEPEPVGVAASEVAPTDLGPTDLQRVVASVGRAFDTSGLAVPRKPWLKELAAVYELARLRQSRTDDVLYFGIEDEPDDQAQSPVAFLPDRDGNMAAFGTGGSGKSTFLRTLAVVAGLSTRGGPCHVYALDFGSRSLQVLQALPHVGAVVNGDDHERIVRLLRLLRASIDERAARYAALNAGTIADYRRLSDQPDEPRILLLVDGVGAFRQAYESGDRTRWFDLFQGIAADGRQVGIHVVVTADRSAAIPTSLASVIQRRLVLRMAGEMEYATLGAPADGFATGTPAGRGFLEGAEVQVAVLGGSANVARQARAIERLGSEMAASDRRPRPKPVERLPERVALSELPVEVQGLPVLGLGDETLEPVGFVPEGTFLVVGPAQSGKTTTVAAMALSLQRWQPTRPFVLLGSSARSSLFPVLEWSESAAGEDDVAALAEDLASRLTSGDGAVDGLVVVIEGLADHLNGAADQALQDLLRAVRSSGAFVITESEATAMVSSWPLLAAARSARHGLALQPDQLDGDAVFRTSFPRLSRVEFPAGRGLRVRSGRTDRVQVPLPELELVLP